jgi:hypothetical protein
MVIIFVFILGSEGVVAGIIVAGIKEGGGREAHCEL